MIISVDHGNKSIKTPNALFTSGLISSEGLQGFKTDYICWNGRYYTLTEQRISYLRDKTEDERFYVLTLFASGIVSDLGLEVNGGMGKQIKEYLALFKTCIYTSLESVIHRTAVIDNGIVDIATCEGCEFAAIRLVLQSGTADGLTTDGIEVIIGQ